METLPSQSLATLSSVQELYVRQSRELAELIGFETRNKYAITTSDKQPIAFAAEQNKGFFGFLARQFLGHWRTFDIQFFNNLREPILRASHPFRWFFQRLEVFDNNGRFLGALQQRFALLTKRFDVEGPDGRVLLEVKSGLFQLWTFPFFKNGEQCAVIEKKWSGILTEMFTDKDNFRVRYLSPTLSSDERVLVLASALFVDLQYFEKKARS
jgi:hypothetical protein